MANQGFNNLLADRVGGIKRRHGLLEDHGKTIAAKVAHRGIGQIQQVRALKTNTPRDVGGRFRQKPHDGKSSHAFAATGFSDESERYATREFEVHGFDGMHRLAAIPVKDHAQVHDPDQIGHRRSPAASSRAISRSITVRSVTPTGSRRLGRKRRKIVQRSRLTPSSRSSSASGSGWSSTRRSRSDQSSSPEISKAADCLPRLSPPAASPARIAAISRRANGIDSPAT